MSNLLLLFECMLYSTITNIGVIFHGDLLRFFIELRYLLYALHILFEKENSLNTL